MSEVIEERSVKLIFDNSKFEENIKQSMESLKKFSGDLAKSTANNAVGSFFGNMGATAGVLAFNKALDSTSSGLQNIQMTFSALGVIGKRVLENLTDGCLRLLNRGINALFGGITQGGLSRAMNIEKAKFQLEGLGVTWEKVSGDINYGVQDTAYGLDAAALAASQLATAGVKMGGVYSEAGDEVSEMGQALRAISGVAGMTGRDYSNIAHIFTTVAAKGKLMGEQLTQLSYAGISGAAGIRDFFNQVNDGTSTATEKTTEAIKKLTKGLKVTEADIVEFTSKGEINFAMFSEAMDNAFGEHAKDANKTVTGALSNIRAAMSKIGANFFGPIIENEGPLVEMLNTVRTKLNELRDNTANIAKGLSTIVNGLITGINFLVDKLDFSKLGSGDRFAQLIHLAQILVGFLQKLAVTGDLVKEAFVNVFPEGLDYMFISLALNIVDLIKNFKITGETAEKLSRIFTGFFSLFKIGINTVSALGKFLSPFIPTLKRLGQTLLSVAATIGDVLRDLSNAYTIQEVADSFVNNLGAIGKALAWFSGMANKAINLMKAFIAMFFPKKQQNDGIAKSIEQTGQSAQKALNPIQLFLDTIQKKFPFLVTFKNLILDLKAAFDKFMNSKTGQAGTIGGSMIASVILGYQLLKKTIKDVPKNLLPEKLMKTLDKLPKQFQQITNNINKVLNNVSNAINQFTKNLQLDGLMKAAKAIAILAASLLVISMINVDKMAPTLAALAGLFVMLNKSLEWLDTKIPAESLVKLELISGVLIKLAAAILVLSFALKVTSSIPWDKMLVGFGGLTLTMVAFVAVLQELSKVQKSTAVASIAILSMANAMMTLSLALKLLSTIEWDKLLVGFGVLTLTMLAMAESLSRLGKLGANGLSAAVGITAISNSLLVLSLALKLLSTIKWNELLVSFGVLALSLFAMTEGLTLLSAIGPRVLLSALALSMLSVALIGMATAFKIIGDVPWPNLLVGFGALILTLYAFVALTDKLEMMSAKIFVGVMAINGLALAVAVLAGSIKLISGDAGGAIGGAFAISMLLTALVGSMYMLKEMDMKEMMMALTMLMMFTGMVGQLAIAMTKIADLGDNLGPATAAILGTIIAMSVALKMLAKSKLDMVEMKNVIFSMNGMALAVKLLASAFKDMASIPWISLLVSLGVLVGSFALLVHFAGPLAAVGPVLWEIAGALALFSAACVGIGAALMMITTAMSIVATMSGTAAIALIEFIRVVATVAGDIATLAMDIFMAFLNAAADYFDQMMAIGEKIAVSITNFLITLIPKFIELGTVIINSLLDGMRTVIPNAIETFNLIFEYFMQSMAAHAQPITEAACDFMINFMNGLKIKIPELVVAAHELMITFINALADVIQTNTAPITNAMTAVINALIAVLFSALPSILDIGVDLISSLIQGIMSMIQSVFQTGTEITAELLKAIGVNEDFVEAGKNAVLGFIDGLGAFTNKVIEKARELGHAAVKALKDVLKINSPSKVTAEVGEGVPEGLALGETRKAGLVEKASSWLGSLIPDSIKNGAKSGMSGLDSVLSGVTDATDQMADEVEGDADRAETAFDRLQNYLRYKSYLHSVETATTSSGNKAYIATHEMNKALEKQKKRLDEDKQAADDTGDSMDNFGKKSGGAAKATDEATSSLEKAIKAFKSFGDLQKSLQEKIESSIDIFSEFDKKTELTGDKLLENMRSQVSGVKEWANNLKILASRGIEKGLLQKLSELGPQGFEKVNAFVQMSDEQLKEANGLYAESLMLPDSVSADIVGSFANAGMWASEGFVNGVDTNAGYQPGQLMGQSLLTGTMQALDEHSPSRATEEVARLAMVGFTNELDRVYWVGRVKATAMKLGQALIEGLSQTLGSADIAKSSRKAIASFVKGLADIKSVVTATKRICITFITNLDKNLPNKTFIEIVQRIYRTIIEAMKTGYKELETEVLKIAKDLKKELSETFEDIGKFATEGLAKGIEKNIKKISDAAIKVSKEATDKAKKTFDESSPSKVMEQIGAYATLGLAKGLTSEISTVSSSSERVTKSVISQFQNAIAKVQDTIDSNIDTTTITPILDLSQVEQGLNNMDALFGSKSFGMSSVFNANSIARAYDYNRDKPAPQEPVQQITNNTYEFTQNNTSPKALSNAEIYRQTKNLFSTVKGATT